MGAEITPFQVSQPEDALRELRRRLAATRWPDAETADGWEQGPPLSYVQELCAVWERDHDWRIAEKRLNAVPQFRTEIDGLDVHFLHARSPHPDATPLLLTHGWPSSVLEFVDLIPELTHPADPSHAFHVVCPSLPGHGFSGKPASSGWTVARTARAWARLMSRLGYQRYGAHGGDWGSWVSAELGTADPEHVLGIHLTMPLAKAPEQPVELDERDQRAMARMTSFGQNRSGYAVIQSTRPQALGYGLADSPAGQLSWILDRLWAWVDHDGDPNTALPPNTLLDTATLYWLTGTGTSSARLFWESFGKEPMNPTNVPVGCSVFPKDAWLPRAWAEQRFTDLRYWKDHDSGGHFSAWERPAVLIDELRAFFALLN
ncbi:epoxide hydrolase family protein [Streptomyces nitrosporeus]|uniref:Epoxide hydrolase n=1 Tax=Streptomyces nitrosporeus TaxID=28894 RepID=A0A5J6FG60_9ACTN|nr:epoxide hydrolase family protein [Streptomyces nitrosporeus]QEU73955.1 epoxide hydrolase [Streptomyces nitrosporeus]GGZ00960.1 hydrolase [Streptomyces nitrosporeus]